MTVVSSFRPHSESGQYRLNQIRAHESWQREFDRIIWFGDPEPELSSENTFFVPSTDKYPTMQEMFEMCSCISDCCFLINADIFISHDIVRAIDRLNAKRAMAAVSGRHEFEPEWSNEQIRRMSKVQDNGVDVFYAIQPVWQSAAHQVHLDYRIGHQQWDTWLTGFFNWNCKRMVYDMTKMRFAFHPRHSERRFEFPVNTENQDMYLSRGGFPPSLQ